MTDIATTSSPVGSGVDAEEDGGASRSGEEAGGRCMGGGSIPTTTSFRYIAAMLRPVFVLSIAAACGTSAWLAPRDAIA
ncbi:hypothetical protein [Chondromyces crocatus]|uniref:hypothetical protein n=1 Tax=Chondromyces crocatus TaxID=52 RepID=UPI00146FE71F|nr:hypothetical protein [Chondromyces crocatus]